MLRYLINYITFYINKIIRYKFLNYIINLIRINITNKFLKKVFIYKFIIYYIF